VDRNVQLHRITVVKGSKEDQDGSKDKCVHIKKRGQGTRSVQAESKGQIIKRQESMRGMLTGTADYWY
jgi:hypothetical protein